MEPIAPLIGISLGIVAAYVIFLSVEYPYRKRREKEEMEREAQLQAQMQANQAKPSGPYLQNPNGFTGYGYTGYGPSANFQDPYGLVEKKDGLREGLKKLL